jgi:hypothetical protein
MRDAALFGARLLLAAGALIATMVTGKPAPAEVPAQPPVANA